MKKLTQFQLILYTSIAYVLFYNYTFFTNVLKVYPFKENVLFISSLGVLLLLVLIIIFTLVSSKYTTKPVLIVVTLVASLVAYFANNYGIVVDDNMIRNTIQTNINESSDLLNLKLILYFTLLGVVPSILIYIAKINYRGFKTEFISKIKVLVISIILMVLLLLSFGKYYASFFREHKVLRYYTNPTYWIYSAFHYAFNNDSSGNKKIKIIAPDANITSKDKKLIIMVVGEAARADHFSLNGYKKDTNPKLQNDDIIDFKNFYSCGTSTAYSVPCMFSVYNRKSYSHNKALHTENVVDILNSTKKVAILWRDNNSDSKGVALNVKYQDYKTPKNNKICDVECRDEGMLIGLDKFIQKNRDKNILIVLHQMGNHGPAYYKRYPKRFEKFKPTCKTNQLDQCTKEQINNAYDNAILYTDYFLDKVINLLKKDGKDRESAMIYMADHGESLGEHGVYLHGLPYFIAPEAQKHIGSIMWVNDKMRKTVNYDKLKSLENKKFSQDNLFHTLLGAFEVKTKVYKKSMDLLHQ